MLKSTETYCVIGWQKYLTWKVLHIVRYHASKIRLLSLLGHPKYLLIFNYGIGIKTGIHFQLRNWLRNWEFGPKVAKIAKFLQNSWQAWICEMLWCHFFHFNAKFKSFNNRILKRKKFAKYIFLKNVKIAQFLAKSGQF